MRPFTVTSSANIVHGELAGSATAAQGPDIPTSYVKIKAAYDNAGTVYIGSSSSVTAKTGSTNTTAGWPLRPGEEQEFMVSNLNLLYRICDNAGDDVLYKAYKGF